MDQTDTSRFSITSKLVFLESSLRLVIERANLDEQTFAQTFAPESSAAALHHSVYFRIIRPEPSPNSSRDYESFAVST
jgi:hypothetical protein